jgi:hypothetical protein
MTRGRGASSVSLIWAAIAFTIAGSCFLGVIFGHDLTGRLLFGITWSAVGTWWIGRFLNDRRSPR